MSVQALLSVKSDSWIRHVAAEQRMIEPFEPRQVKAVDGRPIVSYGTLELRYRRRGQSAYARRRMPRTRLNG